MNILVYDITKRPTFLSLQRWVEEVRKYTSSHVLLVLVGMLFYTYITMMQIIITLRFAYHSHIFSYFIGNKCDLEHQREVQKAEAEVLCQYLPEVLHVVETSAKDNTNVDFIFFCLASELKVNLFLSHIISFYVNFFTN